MARLTYAQAMADALIKEGIYTISRSSYGFIEGVFAAVAEQNSNEKHHKQSHPLDRQQAVMKAVARSEMFERKGRILLGVLTEHERWYPVFRLKRDYIPSPDPINDSGSFVHAGVGL